MGNRTVVLSRKGFDSSAGGKPNWIIGDKLIPIPIPEADTDIFYSDLKMPESDETFRDVMRALSINKYSEAHPDPFISELYRTKQTKDWKYSFGQCGSSLSSLMNNNVGEGSIFLFFGWFKRIENRNGKWKYIPIDGHHKNGVHIIYGYLEIDKVVNISDGVIDSHPWLIHHPHYILRKNKTQYPGDNKIFMAKRAGIFKFSDELILTEKGKSRSHWELHQFMIDDRIKFSYLGEINNTSLKANFRGQEIIGISHQEKLIKWANKIIDKYPGTHKK